MGRNYRLNKLAIALLEKDWGLRADILCPTDTSYNAETGDITRSWRRLSRIQVIILPYTDKYETPAKAKPLGSYSASKRLGIIPGRYLPKDFTLTKNCHMEFKSQRWEISEIYYTEEDSSWRMDLTLLPNIDIVRE